MGMTIDETIYCMNSYLPDHNSDCINCKYYGSKEGVFCCSDKAHQKAIDTMRKYQKIEDIYYHQTGQALENSLRAVIEDGKID